MGLVRPTTRLRCLALCCLLGGGGMVLGFFLPWSTEPAFIDFSDNPPTDLVTFRGSDVFADPFAHLLAASPLLLAFCFALALCFFGGIGLFRRNRVHWVMVGLSTYLVVGYVLYWLLCLFCVMQGGWLLSMAGALVGWIGSIGLVIASKRG